MVCIARQKSVPLALIAIAISLIAFEFCTIFYNATLIQVANSSSIGKVSGSAGQRLHRRDNMSSHLSFWPC